MLKFSADAERAKKEEEGDEQIEVDLFGETFLARPLTTAQYAAFVSSQSAGGTTMVDEIFGVIRAFMGEEAEQHIRRLIRNRVIEMEDILGGREPEDGEEGEATPGVIDALLEEFSGFPTEPSSGSRTSQKSTGRKSTGRSPGKGSTRSKSTSDSSSASS